MLSGLELISEIRHSDAEGLGVGIRAVARTLLRTERACQVVVGEGDVGAVLRV